MISLFPVSSLMNSLIFTISLLFFTSKTLLTEKIEFQLQFFQFLSKTTQNYTQFQALFTATQKKKRNERPAKFFSSFRLGSFFSRLSLCLSLPLIGRLVERAIGRSIVLDWLPGNWQLIYWGMGWLGERGPSLTCCQNCANK